MNNYKKYLEKQNLTENSVKNYFEAYNCYFKKYENINKNNLNDFKNFLIDNYKPKTVNIRILGINKYLEYIKKSSLKLKMIKIQNKTFIDNVISNEDYEYFKTQLYKNGEIMWYFVIRTIAATGARVSELIQFKVEHIKSGFIDIYSKGGKIRRIYIAKNLKNDLLEWLNNKKCYSGFIFCNKFGERITTRGIAHQLKVLASKYKINEDVVYPHSFRHLFAKNFLEKYNDISLLADLLGHDSIETTRIYLRKSSTEQQNIVDSVVVW